jgi:AraC-like DNA-binding protein
MAEHTVHLVDLVKRFGVSADELLKPLGLELDALSDPHARLPLEKIIAVAQRAMRLTGEPGLGFYLGLSMRASWHGQLGLASMLARDIRQALELVIAFGPTRTNTLSFRLVEEGDTASLNLIEEVDFGPARELVVPAVMIGLAEIARALTGQALEGATEFAFPAPKWISRLTELRRGTMRFGQKNHRLVFPRRYLDAAFTLADPHAQKSAVEQCERELSQLGFAGRLSGRVRERLLHADGEVADVDEIAKSLGVSARTLKRRLQEEGTSYSELLDGERHDRALLLLANAALSLEQVAARLGYADSVAFTRAFTRWTGTTPAKHRRGR